MDALAKALEARGMPRVVADGKKERIEHRLNEFIVKLEEEAIRRKRDAERRERDHRRWEEQARNWRRAEEIRAYVAAVEATTIREHGAIPLDGELGQWIAWARHKANWMDPLVAASSPILDTPP